MTDIELIPEGLIELLNAPESLTVLDEAADRIGKAAIANTRIGLDPRWGHIHDAYYLYPAKPGPQGGEAAAANRSAFFHMLEFGTVNNPPERPFSRAITDAGYEAQETPR